jgi:peptidylprolyl isomerase
VGTDKRERQKAGRYERAAAELAAARKQRSRRTAVRLVVGVVAVLALLFGWSLLQGDDDDETATDEDVTSDTTLPEVTTTLPEYANPELAEEVLARDAPETEPPPEDTPADALESTTLIEGEGDGVAAGDSIMAMYVGKTPDGNVFDESWEEGTPIGPIVIGQGQVIPGWDEGLLGAKIGERRHLVIGADNGYGEQGQDPIPPSSPLGFDVDIVDIQPAPEAPEGSDPTGTPDVTAGTEIPDTTTG